MWKLELFLLTVKIFRKEIIIKLQKNSPLIEQLL